MQLLDVRSRFDFQQATAGDDPVVVLFYGDDHDSSRLQARLADLADEYNGRARFVSVNAMAADLLAADFRMKPDHLPTVMLMRNGQTLKSWGNEQNLDTYRLALDAELATIWGR